MKKMFPIIIIVLAVAIAFGTGLLVGKNYQDSVVGVYQTDNWNGKIGTLVLYEDGTCQYPSGGTAKWILDGDTVRITVESKGIIADGTLQEIVSTSEYEAKVMENGLVLHDAFFRKVSN